jgi:hypothetical protein
MEPLTFTMPAALELLADCMSACDKPTEAIVPLRRALQSNYVPFNSLRSRLRRKLAVCLLQCGQIEEARAEAEAFIAMPQEERTEFDTTMVMQLLLDMR